MQQIEFAFNTQEKTIYHYLISNKIVTTEIKDIQKNVYHSKGEKEIINQLMEKNLLMRLPSKKPKYRIININ